MVDDNVELIDIDDDVTGEAVIGIAVVGDKIDIIDGDAVVGVAVDYAKIKHRCIQLRDNCCTYQKI